MLNWRRMSFCFQLLRLTSSGSWRRRCGHPTGGRWRWLGATCRCQRQPRQSERRKGTAILVFWIIFPIERRIWSSNKDEWNILFTSFMLEFLRGRLMINWCHLINLFQLLYLRHLVPCLDQRFLLSILFFLHCLRLNSFQIKRGCTFESIPDEHDRLVIPCSHPWLSHVINSCQFAFPVNCHFQLVFKLSR